MNLLLLLAKSLAKLSGDWLSLSIHHPHSDAFCLSTAKRLVKSDINLYTYVYKYLHIYV